jgi:hypothetical protein
MNHKEHTPPPRQTPLPLGNGAQWEQLPPDVRDRCRQLVAQLLTDLTRSWAAGGNDER